MRGEVRVEKSEPARGCGDAERSQMQVLEAPTTKLAVLNGPSHRRQNGFPRVEVFRNCEEGSAFRY